METSQTAYDLNGWASCDPSEATQTRQPNEAQDDMSVMFSSDANSGNLLVEVVHCNDVTPAVTVRRTLDEALSDGQDKAIVSGVTYSQRHESLRIDFNPDALTAGYVAMGMLPEKARNVALAVSGRAYYVPNKGGVVDGKPHFSFELPVHWADLTTEARVHFTRIFDENGLRQDRRAA